MIIKYIKYSLFLIALLTVIAEKKIPEEFFAKVTAIRDGFTIEVLYKRRPVIIYIKETNYPKNLEVLNDHVDQYSSEFYFNESMKITTKEKHDRYKMLIVEIEDKNKEQAIQEYVFRPHKEIKKTKVYICKTTSYIYYHINKDCKELNKCSNSFRKITLKKANNFGRTLCRLERE